MIDELHTGRLVLRRFGEADRDAWATMHADPAMMATLGPVLDRAGADAQLDGLRQRFDEHGYGWWCVALDGRCIGAAGLNTPRWEPPFAWAGQAEGRPCVEAGWRLAAAQWGRGYATEAAAAAIADGFERLALEEVVAFTAEVNERSQRVMQRLGFTRDPAGDFDHPNLFAGDPLRRHLLYRLPNPALLH